MAVVGFQDPPARLVEGSLADVVAYDFDKRGKALSTAFPSIYRRQHAKVLRGRIQ